MTDEQLPTPEELQQRAGEMRGKIGRLKQLESEVAELRAYKEETERQKNGSVVRASETEEQLRGELMRTIGELSDAQQTASRLEERAKRAEAEIANVQTERDDAIRAAEESGKILNKVEQRTQEIEQEKEILSVERERLEVELNGLQEQLKGKTTGDTLALKTELEIIIKAAEGKTDEKPITELGQKAYNVVVGADSQHKKAFLALKAEAEEITAALSEGRYPKGIKSPFNNALYQALLTKLGEAAPAQTPEGDDLSGIANAVCFGMLADIVETGEVPNGLPEEAKDAAQRIKAYVDAKAAQAPADFSSEREAYERRIADLKQEIETVRAESEREIEAAARAARDLEQFNREINSQAPDETAPKNIPATSGNSVPAPANTSPGSSSQRITASAIKEDAEKVKKELEEKTELERKLAAAEKERDSLAAKEKEQSKLLRDLTAELTSSTELLTEGARRLTEAETRAQQQIAAAKKEKDAAVDQLKKVLPKLKAARGLEDKLAAEQTRAETAEQTVREYEDGTIVPAYVVEQKEDLISRIAELRTELDAIKENETTLRQKLERAEKRANADGSTLREYLKEQDDELDQHRDLAAIVYVNIANGTPMSNEVLDALKSLAEHDEDVRAHYAKIKEHGVLPNVRLGAYSRAREALSEAAQHDRTGRTPEALKAYDRAARLFEEAIIEQINDKEAAYNAARLTSQAQSALRLGPQAIAWAHLAERLAPASEQTTVYFTLCEAYAANGNREKAKEYLALAEKSRAKPATP